MILPLYIYFVPKVALFILKEYSSSPYIRQEVLIVLFTNTHIYELKHRHSIFKTTYVVWVVATIFPQAVCIAYTSMT